MREMITPKGPSPPERAPTEKYEGPGVSRSNECAGSGHVGHRARGAWLLRDPFCIELARRQVSQGLMRPDLPIDLVPDRELAVETLGRAREVLDLVELLIVGEELRSTRPLPCG